MVARRRTRTIWIAVGLLAALPLLALVHPRVRAVLRLSSGFVPLEAGSPVLYESGARELAQRIADALPSAMAKVESAHSLPFQSGFRVYVCASHESFTRRLAEPADSPARGMALGRDVWISPKAFAFHGADTHWQTLAHELSHLHLSQHLGVLGRTRRVPAWFAEGLADWVADTGGEVVSREQAVVAMSNGRRLVPDDEGTFLLSKRASDYGLSWPMFHRQSRMLVEYLRDRDPRSFQEFVVDLLGGTPFEAAFTDHFGTTLSEVSQEFSRSL